MSTATKCGPPRPHTSQVELVPETEGPLKGLRRVIHTRAAFDQRDDNPRDDYGIGGVHITLALIDDDRAVEWEMFTDSYLPETKARLQRQHGNAFSSGTSGGRVHFHSRTPIWPEQGEHEQPSDECTWIGGPCWNDVGFSIGDDVHAAWAHGGLDGAFGKMLELLPDRKGDAA